MVVAVTHAGSADLHRHLRELLARHKGEPFAVLGVSVDPRKADLDASIKAGDVTWPSWWDGLDGPDYLRLEGQRGPASLRPRRAGHHPHPFEIAATTSTSPSTGSSAS